MVPIPYLRVVPRAVSTADGLESVDPYFIEPGFDLLIEIGGGVILVAWGASCPSGCEVLADGESTNVALGSAVMSRDALVGPTLSCGCQLIVPHL